MKAPCALLLAAALAVASPALAQTTGSESCTTLIHSAANAASSRVSADDTDIPKPQSVKNFTCLDKFFNGTGLNVVINLLNPTNLLNAVESEICNKLTSIWQSTIGKAQCGITLTGFKMGFLGGGTLGGGLSCPKSRLAAAARPSCRLASEAPTAARSRSPATPSLRPATQSHPF